ncbi:DUF6463 family protein [Nocardia sp. NPDC051570]|uniref:DUF6463 family protein n=1 Tax=Nocardia sp. NPDC051570 TaxID=3364324 RepID=UPI00378A484B
MIKWAGWIFVLCGIGHTIGALTVDHAARYAGAWFGGALWHDDLAAMSSANSAYWLSVDSFGPPLVLLGLTVVWLDRRGITPPPFIGWALLIWTVIDTVVLPLTPWPIFLLATILLLVGTYRGNPVLQGR